MKIYTNFEYRLANNRLELFEDNSLFFWLNLDTVKKCIICYKNKESICSLYAKNIKCLHLENIIYMKYTYNDESRLITLGISNLENILLEKILMYNT